MISFETYMVSRDLKPFNDLSTASFFNCWFATK